MKGIELPINVLVIVAVAVIVLLGIIALYFGGFVGPAGVMTQQTAKEKYCAIVMRTPNGCTVGTKWVDSVTISDFDANKDTNMNAGANWCWGTAPNDPAAGACGAATTCNAAGTSDNLAALLTCYYGITNERDALRACGCTI